MNKNEIYQKLGAICRINNCSKEVALFILAQMVLETGGLESRICRENKNLFGMKLAKKRITTAKGEEYGHAKYDTYEESILDYFNWLNYNGFTQKQITNVKDFKTKLANSNYSTTKDYIERIERIFNS